MRSARGNLGLSKRFFVVHLEHGKLQSEGQATRTKSRTTGRDRPIQDDNGRAPKVRGGGRECRTEVFSLDSQNAAKRSQEEGLVRAARLAQCRRDDACHVRRSIWRGMGADVCRKVCWHSAESWHSNDRIRDWRFGRVFSVGDSSNAQAKKASYLAWVCKVEHSEKIAQG